MILAINDIVLQIMLSIMSCYNVEFVLQCHKLRKHTFFSKHYLVNGYEINNWNFAVP